MPDVQLPYNGGVWQDGPPPVTPRVEIPRASNRYPIKWFSSARSLHGGTRTMRARKQKLTRKRKLLKMSWWAPQSTAKLKKSLLCLLSLRPTMTIQVWKHLLTVRFLSYVEPKELRALASGDITALACLSACSFERYTTSSMVRLELQFPVATIPA